LQIHTRESLTAFHPDLLRWPTSHRARSLSRAIFQSHPYEGKYTRG
jgi:hypothetical protein